jgi:hypothetical protein
MDAPQRWVAPWLNDTEVRAREAQELEQSRTRLRTLQEEQRKALAARERGLGFESGLAGATGVDPLTAASDRMRGIIDQGNVAQVALDDAKKAGLVADLAAAKVTAWAETVKKVREEYDKLSEPLRRALPPDIQKMVGETTGTRDSLDAAVAAQAKAKSDAEAAARKMKSDAESAQRKAEREAEQAAKHAQKIALEAEERGWEQDLKQVDLDVEKVHQLEAMAATYGMVKEARDLDTASKLLAGMADEKLRAGAEASLKVITAVQQVEAQLPRLRAEAEASAAKLASQQTAQGKLDQVEELLGMADGHKITPEMRRYQRAEKDLVGQGLDPERVKQALRQLHPEFLKLRNVAEEFSQSFLSSIEAAATGGIKSFK